MTIKDEIDDAFKIATVWKVSLVHTPQQREGADAMNSPQIEEAAAYVRELAAKDTDHREMFRLCAERFPDMLKKDFTLAIQIAMHDEERDGGED